jgi:two-component system, CAI-1 autoinducer sensor kinase/phosphatase CqsS
LKENIVPVDWLGFHRARKRLGHWLLDEIVHAPLEPILHPSRMRLLWIGTFTFLGHLVFFWIWRYWYAQPYENMVIRLVMALLALMYVMPLITKDPASERGGRLFGIATWIQLPWFFSWMYWMNEGSAVWLASVVAMVLIYYHATDWRLATIGLMSGGMAGWASADWMGVNFQTIQASPEHAIVIMFSCVMGLMLGFSSANLRRVRLLNTLSTMGVMAHELRTPLATVNLMGDVLRTLATHDLPEAKRNKIENFSTRLQNLVRSMNRQIDTQISNAQMLRLPNGIDTIMAAEVVQAVVDDFPYRSSRERDCVQVHIRQDFCFVGSRPLFAQVLLNLLKNALHALASANRTPLLGDVRLDVGLHHDRGRIAVSDDGVGISRAQQQRIFEPFYSTQGGAGNGLGLTFCKNVVEAANGTLSVHSEPGLGAVFIIDLPLK